jgi:transcriptional regulator with XRE-family HTH domain
MGSSEDDILVRFGHHLRKLRLQKGWSQEKLAAASDLHRTYIGAIERGEQNMSLKNLGKLAQTLKIPLSQLMDFEGKSE